jgi:hypothetical protein
MPENFESTATFTDVLELGVDATAFKAGLEQLRTAYNEFIASLGDGVKGQDVLNIGSMQALQQSVESLVTSISTARAELTSTLADVSAGVVDSLSQMSTVIGEKLQAGAQGAKQVREEVENIPAPAADVEAAFGKWVGSIGKTAVTLIEFLVIMKAIQVIGEIIAAPFKLMAESIKEGFEYLTKLQTSAADLQGVLANNVKFTTEGIVKNFQEAGEAADYVVRRLQDISIRVNLPVQNLTSSFKAVADSGGAAFVKDLDQMVKLSELFAISVKATGKDFQVQRALISEIPKLLDGTVTSQSLILRTLGLTKDAWEKIRESGLKNKDLVSELEPLLTPFLTVAEQADLRMGALKEKLELIKDRLLGIMALPLFQMVLDWMQKVSEWLDDNKESLEVIFKSAGDAIVDAVGFAKLLFAELLKIFGIVPSSGGFLTFLDDQIDKFRELIAASTAYVKILEAILNPKVSRKVDIENILAQYQAAIDKIQEDENKLDAILAGGDPGTPGGGNKAILGGTSPNPVDTKSKDALAQLTRDFKAEIENIKQLYKGLEEERKKALDTGEINMKAYTTTVKMLAEDEKQAFIDALKAFDAKAEKTGAKGTAVNKAKDNAAQSILKDKGTLNAQIAGLDDALAKYEIKLQEDSLEHSRKLSLEQLQDEKKVAQATGATKTEVAQLDIAIQKKSFDAQTALLDQEVVAAGLNEKKLEDISFRRAQLTQQNNTAIALNNKALNKAILTDLIESDKKLSAADHERYNQLVAQQTATNLTRNSQKQLAASNLELAKINLGIVNSDVARVAGELALAKAQGADKKTVDDLTESLQKLKTERDKATQVEQQDQKVADGDQARLDELHKIFGDGVTGINDAFSQGFGQGVASLLNAFTFFNNAITGLINAFKQGSQQGGTLGGIGAVATSVGSQLSSVFPVAGAIVGGLGQVMSLVGGLFKAQAQHIADEIKKAFDKTRQDLQNGSINLSQAIQQISQERADAVARLSGKKGGKDQLNQLLPQLDQQLASLKQQQKQVLDTFEQQLNTLRLQSDTLGKFLDSWTNINKQVKDYLDAGGSVAKANEFLSLSLKSLQKQTQDSLDQGQQTAIQDAIQLNDLLTQRLNLIKTIAQNEFQAATADSLERNQAGAIVRGTALSNLKADDAKQLDDINAQIDLQTKKVDKERQVFDIATDITALHKQDADLQLKALDSQIAQWKDMQTIINGIVNNNGIYSLSAFLLALLGLTPPSTGNGSPSGDIQSIIDSLRNRRGIGGGPQPFQSDDMVIGQVGAAQPAVQIGTVTINATGDPTAIAGQVVDSLTVEIQRRVAQGRGAFVRF